MVWLKGIFTCDGLVRVFLGEEGFIWGGGND